MVFLDFLFVALRQRRKLSNCEARVIATLLIEEGNEAEIMSQDEAVRTLELLARWAIRRAQKEGRLSAGGPGKAITTDVSKGPAMRTPTIDLLRLGTEIMS
jgi:hypothetical protein